MKTTGVVLIRLEFNIRLIPFVLQEIYNLFEG